MTQLRDSFWIVVAALMWIPWVLLNMLMPHFWFAIATAHLFLLHTMKTYKVLPDQGTEMHESWKASLNGSDPYSYPPDGFPGLQYWHADIAPSNWWVLGRIYVVLILQAIFYISLAILRDINFDNQRLLDLIWKRKHKTRPYEMSNLNSPPGYVDPDVQAETARCKNKLNTLLNLLKVKKDFKVKVPKDANSLDQDGARNCCCTVCCCCCLVCGACLKKIGCKSLCSKICGCGGRATTYETKSAVKDISFQVQPGECFGLLGTNGAGKTTIFKMITGEHKIGNFREGEIHIDQLNLRDQAVQCRENLGYCPQEHSLHNLLTVREHLELFSKVRGTPKHLLEMEIQKSLILFGLKSVWEDTLSSNLSGGGKRRLNTSLAFAGQPKLVLLDEPTAGLDPAARNLVWTRIDDILKNQTGVLLTSHSVSEVEKVCNKLGIMVAGQFKCFGTPSHLINKFGSGYVLVVKLKAHQSSILVSDAKINEIPLPETDIKTQALQYLETHFQNIKIIENESQKLDNEASLDETRVHHSINTLRLKLEADLPVSKIFEILQAGVEQNILEGFSVNQNTLDDIFVMMAREDVATGGNVIARV